MATSSSTRYLLEEYLVLHETHGDMFDRERSPICDILDDKLTKSLGYSETIFNHSTTVEQRIALLDIVFCPKKLSSLDKDATSKLYLNLLSRYTWWKDAEKKEHMKPKMKDFVLSDTDKNLLSAEVNMMKAMMAKVKMEQNMIVKK